MTEITGKKKEVEIIFQTTASYVSCSCNNYFNARPGRLTDGPYTSYDLNTLLRATAGKRHAVRLGQGMSFIIANCCYLRLSSLL